MIVYILEYKLAEGDVFTVHAVYSTAVKAYAAITGDDIDYERASDTEEWFHTSEGFWFLTIEEVK